MEELKTKLLSDYFTALKGRECICVSYNRGICAMSVMCEYTHERTSSFMEQVALVDLIAFVHSKNPISNL